MRSAIYATALLVVITIIAPVATARNTSDMPAAQTCTLADTEFWAPKPIDTSACGLEGTGDAAHRAQNLVKNELCAGDFLTSSPTETPARVTQLSFRRLQEEASDIRDDLGLGPRAVPPDRTRFQETVYTTTDGAELSEGSLVRYVGFLLEGHFTGPEDVNCDRSRQPNFDIHMAFVQQRPPTTLTTAQANALECASVTAEIIPRRRPESWDLLGRLKKTSGANALRGALNKIAAHDLDRPLRITGQLFFDGSHEACRNGQKIAGQPARVSNWEIHPVYWVEVCTLESLTSCRWDRDQVWRTLDDFFDDEG